MSVMFRETVDEASSFKIKINAMDANIVEPNGLQVGVRIYKEGY